MSTLKIETVMIESVDPHPNADRLDVITIGGYKICDRKGKYAAGDIVAYFPPDILIPSDIATQLGVAQYLKAAIYPGESKKSNCRVGAIRLRGVPSFGFILKVNEPVGKDLTERFHGAKFEPPEPMGNITGLRAKDDIRFHTYTNIENWRKYKNAMPNGLPVRITEKIHGTNSRVGLIAGEYMCGSHKTALKPEDNTGRPSMYWMPLTSDMKSMLSCISEGRYNVIVFGEIFGSKIQFMDYGITGCGGYRVFDISVGGEYLPWEQVVYYCNRFCIPLVPLVYKGAYSPDIVEQLVDGPTMVAPLDQIRCDFKGREGVVITPLKETYSLELNGRLILKAVSVDYLASRRSDSH